MAGSLIDAPPVPRSEDRDRWAGRLLLLALPSLIAGLTMPALSVIQVGLFTVTYSIAGVVFSFWSSGDFFLFGLLLVFSLVLPAAKVLIAIWAWYYARRDDATVLRVLRVFAAISKWSMLDVFVVALTVLVVESSFLASADIHSGIFLFALSVILSTIAIQRLAKGAAGADRKSDD